jgi:hypothetical protein
MQDIEPLKRRRRRKQKKRKKKRITHKILIIPQEQNITIQNG